MSVTYTAALAVRDETVRLLTGLLDAERARRGTRRRWWATNHLSMTRSTT